MAVHEIAIDLGSSYTTIFKRGSGVVLREPTIVCLHTGKQNRVKEVGLKAKKMQGRTGENSVIVYPVCEGVIKNVELTSAMLKDFITKIFPTGRKRIKALVGIPCGLTNEELGDYQKVLYSSGVSQVQFVPSIIASAVGDKLKVSQARGSVVVNIGGGTSDVAVISLNTIINGCSVNIGGKMMDNAIAEFIAEKFNINVGDLTSERIKHDVGSLYETDRSSTEFNGTDLSSNRPVSDVVLAVDIREAIIAYYEGVIETIRAVMNSCKPDIIADISENGVYVSGGASAITGLDQYFRKSLRLPVIVSENPESSVITGLGHLLNDNTLLQEIINEN
jgi:rod shape-determining protein MreB